jgi:long-subunit fatty acid transport protein
MDGNSIDSKRLFNSTDFGINFGAGYDFTEKFSAGVRYNMGVSNIFSDEFKDALQEDVSVQNSVFSLSLAYKF